MVKEGEWGRSENRNPTFRCIAHRQRRVALEALFTWGTPQSERRLADYIVAKEHGTPFISPTDVDSVHAGLVHNHLPTMEDTHLITWDRDSGEIETTDHPAYNDPRFQQLLSLEAKSLDRVLDELAHEYRRIVLTVLRDNSSAMTVEALVREIHHRHGDESEPPSTDLDEVQLALYHTHIPKLADDGFIEYTPGTDRVSYTAHPVLEEVFEAIYNPSETLTEKATGFFNELQETMEQSTPDSRAEFDWPHSWRRPHNG